MSVDELLQIVAVLACVAMFVGPLLIAGEHLLSGVLLVSGGFITFIVIILAFPEALLSPQGARDLIRS